MNPTTLFRGAALALAIALAPPTASAEEPGTVVITGTLHMDGLGGTSGGDLATVFATQTDHTWTLTLYGTTYRHASFGTQRMTNVYAESFHLEFSGPEAGRLNALVSYPPPPQGDHFPLQMRNAYDSMIDFAVLSLAVDAGGISLVAFADMEPSLTLFASDADGYPIVESEPSSVTVEYTTITDLRPGYDDAITSMYSTVSLMGELGGVEPWPPSTVRVVDASVVEGDRGSSKMRVSVTLSNQSDSAITVDYRTVAGTALAKSDYSAMSGTLTFQPGETWKTITVSIKTDRIAEAHETFTVELSNVNGATIADAVATATISNDD